MDEAQDRLLACPDKLVIAALHGWHMMPILILSPFSEDFAVSKPVLLIEGQFHFGDNPGVFQSATYVGLSMKLPLIKTWINDQSPEISFVFTTTDVETWGNWEGHQVLVNGTLIGRLKDKDDQQGHEETFVVTCSREDFLELLGDSDAFTLSIELERRESAPGFSDDFVLRRIATKDLAVNIG